MMVRGNGTMYGPWTSARHCPCTVQLIRWTNTMNCDGWPERSWDDVLGQYHWVLMRKSASHPSCWLSLSDPPFQSISFFSNEWVNIPISRIKLWPSLPYIIPHRAFKICLFLLWWVSSMYVTPVSSWVKDFHIFLTHSLATHDKISPTRCIRIVNSNFCFRNKLNTVYRTLEYIL